jgi:hypothetical protein
MSRTKVDIDTILGEDQLELSVGGKVYIVKDVSLETFLSTTKVAEEEGQDPQILHKQLATMFGVNVEDLKDIGFRAAMTCIQEITKWVYSQTEAIGVVGSDTENP